MIKNHLHWNEDVWENPDSGMQEDLEAVQTRDVEISSVGTIAPSGLSDEQLQSYLETVSVEINGSDTLLGAQSGALNNINKELQMTGDTSARLGGVDRSLLLQGQDITKHSEDITAQGQAIDETNTIVSDHTVKIKDVIEVKIPEVRKIANDAVRDLTDLTPRVSAAEQAVETVTSSVTVLTPKVTAAQSSANKGILDAKAAADSLTQYQGTNDVAVNDAQNTAIQANAAALAAQAILNANQAKWNNGVTVALQSQSTLNEKQDSWNQAVVDAVNATQAADQAQDLAIQSINDMQDALDRQVSEMTNELRGIQQQLNQEKTSSMLTPYNDSWDRSNVWADVTRVTSGTNRYSFTAKGIWTGKVKVILATRADSKGATQFFTSEYPIPQPNGSRTFQTPGYIYLDSAEATITVNPGVQKTRNLTTQAFTPARDAWVTISNHTFTPPAEPAESYLLFWRVEWGAATNHDFYRIRIIQGGRVIVEQELTNLGPLLPVGPGNRAQWIRAPRAKLDPNTPVEFQINSTGEQDNRRNISWSESQISWIDNQ